MGFNIQAAIDAAFSALDAEIATQNTQIVDLEHQAELLLAAADKAKDELLTAQQTLAFQLATIDDLTVQNAVKASEIANKKVVIADLEAEVDRLEARIKVLEAGTTPPPPPPPPPDPEVPPPPAGTFPPNASNTGVPAGTVLSAYTGPLTITAAGTVIDGKIINGSLRVSAPDVVIKNSQINFKGMWGVDGDGAKNLTVQDCDIVGPGSSADSNSAILGSGTFLRNDISKTENGIVLQGGKSVVKANYIHDLLDGGKDPHYDGISVQGGQDDVLIEGNHVTARDTSAIFIKDDFGPIKNVRVIGNYCDGNPGYQIYSDARGGKGGISGVQIKDNVLKKGGYGYLSIENNSPVISGNMDLSGKPI